MDLLREEAEGRVARWQGFYKGVFNTALEAAGVGSMTGPRASVQQCCLLKHVSLHGAAPAGGPQGRGVLGVGGEAGAGRRGGPGDCEAARVVGWL